MYNNPYLQRAKKLSQVTRIEDVPALSAANFPGSHCPLFGALLALRQIPDAAFLVVGTDECTFYSKSMLHGFGHRNHVDERCFSLVLDEKDVSFGCRDKLSAALHELKALGNYPVVFVISTCVVELIGDDLESILAGLEAELEIKLPLIHTEHFKCENHQPGLERSLESLCHLMEEPEEIESMSVNLIGHRHGDFEASELAAFLKHAGIRVRLVLPSEAPLNELKRASEAALNLVVDATGLALAKRMEERFDFPYVYFDRFLDPEAIEAAYLELATLVHPDDEQAAESLVSEFLAKKKSRLQLLEAQARERLAGRTFIYGNTPFMPLNFCLYLAKLGMIPQMVQVRNLGPKEAEVRETLLTYADPYLSKNANIAPLQTIYDCLKPDFYIGHEFAARLRKKGIIVLACDRLGKQFGLQLCEGLLKLLLDSADASDALKAELEQVQLKECV
ncbi:MAG: nitrogenase component 1 [Eubacteriales bacterium]|nr:nitrogenase component 1 [Eubacteriales bacterium]